MGLREVILEADDLAVEFITVPQWGNVKIKMVGLDGAEQAKMLKAATADADDLDLTKIYPDMIIACAFDPETGARIFGPDDRAAILAKSSQALNRVAATAIRLSGFDEGIFDDAGKGSSPSQSSGTSSS